MRFPMDRPVKVVMLGAGGTGGYVAPYLFRLLHMLDRPARFIICDGDLVEAKNLDRQNFVEADLGENKARVLSERYSAVLGMETEYVPNFIETLPELMTLIEPGEWETDGYPRRKVREMVLLLGCVDNNRTRQLCHEAFKKSLDLIYIDSGNGSYTGQVVCGVRKNGRTVRRPIGGVHPEMLKVIDRFPSELSCAEAAQADPQSIVANVTAATAVLTMVYNILTHGENIALQTDFSTRTIRMQTVLEKQPRRKVRNCRIRSGWSSLRAVPPRYRLLRRLRKDAMRSRHSPCRSTPSRGSGSTKRNWSSNFASLTASHR